MGDGERTDLEEYFHQLAGEATASRGAGDVVWRTDSVREVRNDPDLLLLDRTTPDTMGTRQVLVAYEEIHAVKITDVVQPKLFRGLGFGRKSANGKSTAGAKLASGVGSGR